MRPCCHSLDFWLYYQKWSIYFLRVSTVRVRSGHITVAMHRTGIYACFHTGASAVFTLQPGLQKTTRNSSPLLSLHGMFLSFELFIPRIPRNGRANTSNTINATQSSAWDWRTCTRHWHFCQHLFGLPVPSNLPIDNFFSILDPHWFSELSRPLCLSL